MKSKFSLVAFALFTVWNLNPACLAFSLAGTSFTYQGRLNDGATPATGSYDLRFTVYDSTNLPGIIIAGPLTNSATPVTNGLFTVTLDFGTNVFNLAERWLEIATRANNAAPFTTLSPRQKFAAAPYAITAANAATLLGTLPASQINGVLPYSQLPPEIVTNGASSVSLTGTFGGSFGAFSNLQLSASALGTPNRLRFTDNTGNEQIYLHANRDMAFETENDGTAWVGRDFISVVDRDSTLHIKHDSTVTVDNNFTLVNHKNLAATIDSDLAATVGGKLNATVAQDFSITANNQSFTSLGSTVTSVGTSQSSTVGGNMTLTVGSSLSETIGNNFNISAGHNFTATAAAVGLGTDNPQGNLHIYSASNPTIVRVQSTGTPGFGRLEFVSNPQGDVNEWRPAFIQSLDAGGFTGGIGFYVNGTGSGNKFATNEVMRIQNGRVGIGTTIPVTLLQVGNATCNGTTWVNASDRNVKENFQPVNAREVLNAVAALPVSRWNYKTETTATHLGPVAQDFHSAFGLNGADDTHISTVDEGGVALAAIQGLNEKVDAGNRDAQERIQKLETENAELKQRLEKIEQLLAAAKGSK